MWTFYIRLYKQPRVKKERGGGDNGTNRLGIKYLASIGCDVEKVQEWKETRAIWGEEGAIEQSVIDNTDRWGMRKYREVLSD
jgi:hypothetical protein